MHGTRLRRRALTGIVGRCQLKRKNWFRLYAMHCLPFLLSPFRRFKDLSILYRSIIFLSEIVRARSSTFWVYDRKPTPETPVMRCGEHGKCVDPDNTGVQTAATAGSEFFSGFHRGFCVSPFTFQRSPSTTHAINTAVVLDGRLQLERSFRFR